MNKKTTAVLATVLISLVACAAPSGPDGADEQAVNTQSSALDIKETPGSGGSCHADGAGVTNGTMTNDGWCCGVSKCDDQQICGDEYGHYVPACAACDWYKCDPGASRVKTFPRPELLDFADAKALLVRDGAGFQTPYAPATKAGVK